MSKVLLMGMNKDLLRFMELLVKSFPEQEELVDTHRRWSKAFDEDDRTVVMVDELKTDLNSHITPLMKKTIVDCPFLNGIHADKFYDRLSDGEKDIFWYNIHKILRVMVMVTSLGETIGQFEDIAISFAERAKTNPSSGSNFINDILSNPDLSKRMSGAFQDKDSIVKIIKSVGPMLKTMTGNSDVFEEVAKAVQKASVPTTTPLDTSDHTVPAMDPIGKPGIPIGNVKMDEFFSMLDEIDIKDDDEARDVQKSIQDTLSSLQKSISGMNVGDGGMNLDDLLGEKGGNGSTDAGMQTATSLLLEALGGCENISTLFNPRG
jgi:hypothetical protein